MSLCFYYTLNGEFNQEKEYKNFVTEKGISHMITLRQQEKQIYRERKAYTMKFLSGGVLDGLLWRMRKRLLPLDYNSYNPYQLLLQ